ncbi:DoxX family protein [Roseomonas rosulenta]|uniref:DoxX family protein n=1 Tax=Roseomonas rosulenta TaxID=2748667 RepID=UPI0018E053A5|nr:DoxX family protein [Roseomonas rosulenta]
MSRTDRILRLLAWPAAIWIAYEFTWYQQYKLTGHPGSVNFIFQPLADWFGIPAYEKPFRLGVASMEILASILVLLPRTRAWGGLLTIGIMLGAIFFHTIGPIGIDPYGDGGKLFKEAIFTWLMGAFVAIAHRQEIIATAARFGLRLPGARTA